MRRAGGGTTWTSGGAGGGAKQKGENDGAVRIRTKGSKVEVIIIDKAEQRKQEMREAEAESKRRASRIVKIVHAVVQALHRAQCAPGAATEAEPAPTRSSLKSPRPRPACWCTQV